MGNTGKDFSLPRKNKLSGESRDSLGLQAGPCPQLPLGTRRKERASLSHRQEKPQYVGALKQLETGLSDMEKGVMAISKGPSPHPRSFSTQPG